MDRNLRKRPDGCFLYVEQLPGEGCFVENERKDSLLALSFEDVICSMKTETIEGVTRLQVELQHLQTGTTVQISAGVPSRKIRRCTGTRGVAVRKGFLGAGGSNISADEYQRPRRKIGERARHYQKTFQVGLDTTDKFKEVCATA